MISETSQTPKLKTCGFSFLTVCMLAVFFAGSVFLTSSKFNNEQNSAKWFYLIACILSWLLMVLLCFKDLKCLIDKCFSPWLLKCYFVTGTVQAMYAFTQMIGATKSNHILLRITGSFENPAGLVSVLSLLFPVGLLWFSNSKGLERLFVALQLLSFIIVVFLCGSRTGLTAIISSTVVYCFIKIKSFRLLVSNYAAVLCIVIISSLLGYALFCWKHDSSSGRLFILYISMLLVLKKPLFGYGPHGFTANYMIRQAEFFSSNPDSSYSMLADNIVHPFNEYVNILVNFGLTGLFAVACIIVFFICKLTKHHNKVKGQCVWFSVLVSFLTLCMFSYPLHYAHVWYVILMLSIYAVRIYIPHVCHFARRIPVMLLCIIALCMVRQVIVNELRWKKVEQEAMKGRSDPMMKYYEMLYPQMKHNYLFIYNYAAELNICCRYKESIQMVMDNITRLNDYETRLLLADSYENVGDIASAIESYTLAHNMIPNRFVPLYCLMELYSSCGNDSLAQKMAWEITDKPVKVPSETVSFIKERAKVHLTQAFIDL